MLYPAVRRLRGHGDRLRRNGAEVLDGASAAPENESVALRGSQAAYIRTAFMPKKRLETTSSSLTSDKFDFTEFSEST